MAGHDPKAYVPDFSWRKDETGVQGLYDHSRRIARLDERASPHGPHYADVLLNEVFLRPPCVGRIEAEDQGYLFPRWRFHVYFVHRIEELKVLEEGSRFRVYLRTCDQEVRDPDKGLYQRTLKQHGMSPQEGRHPVFHDETFLTVAYSHERESYVHDVRSRLTINSGRKLCVPFVLNHLEYQDLMPAGSFYPHMEGYSRRKYQWQVWEAPDGKVYKIPLHHLKSPDKQNIRIREDGIFAYLLEEAGNPVIQLLGDTASRSEIAICWWMWDPHVYLLTPGRTTCEPGEAHEVRYRLYEMNETDGRALLARAALRPESSLDGVAAPVFHFGLNTFDEPVCAEVESEDWFWECNEERWRLPRDQRHCHWDRDVGRGGTWSLALRGDSASDVWHWTVPFCGNHMRPPVRLSPQQRLTAYVKTDGAAGKVRVGFRLLNDPNRGSDAETEYASPELSGTHDWTRVELVTSPASGGGNGQVFLELEGNGRAWFDDVEVVNVE